MAPLPGWKAAALTPVLLALAAGCGQEEELVLEPSDAIDVPAEVLAASGSRSRQAFATTPTVLYLHFDGITITRTAKSDAAINASFIGGGTVPAFVGDQTTRAQVVSLVKQLYAKYNIQIVTARPTSGNYDMAVIGGQPADLGLPYPPGVVGVAPMDCNDAMPRDIAFIFSDSLRAIVSPSSYVKHVAQTTAHESAHTYGLPHSNDGCDMMSYKSCLQLKAFLDKTMSMQSDSYGQCGLTSMNSHQLLLKTVGPVDSTQPPPVSDTQPPSITISSPTGGSSVQASTTVRASISDDHGVTRAELLIDGKVAGTRTTPPFDFPASLTPGQHTLTVTGYDAAGNKGTATITITVEDSQTAPPPAPGPAPIPDPTPEPGPVFEPVRPPEPGAFGAGCEKAADCQSGLCASDGAGKYCTQPCDPAADPCPGGASCMAAIGPSTHVCSAPGLATAADPSNMLIGSCAMAGGSAGVAPLWPALLALLLLALRPRRRR